MTTSNPAPGGRRPRPRLSAALALGLAAAAGCGGGTPGMSPVRGRVLVRGQPAEGVLVTLHPPAGGAFGRRAMDATGADGSFRISTAGPDDGVPPGEYAVTLVWPEYTPDGDVGPDRLNGRYATPAAAFTTISVADKAVELDPFDVRE